MKQHAGQLVQRTAGAYRQWAPMIQACHCLIKREMSSATEISLKGQSCNTKGDIPRVVVTQCTASNYLTWKEDMVSDASETSRQLPLSEAKIVFPGTSREQKFSNHVENAFTDPEDREVLPIYR
jgi:hypothetical protein